jgi:hypothetical protein
MNFHSDTNAAIRSILTQMKTSDMTKADFTADSFSVRFEPPSKSPPATLTPLGFFGDMEDAGVSLDLRGLLHRASIDCKWGPFSEASAGKLMDYIAEQHTQKTYFQGIDPWFLAFECKWMNVLDRYVDFVSKMCEVANRKLKIHIEGGRLDYGSGEAWIEIRHRDDNSIERWGIGQPGKYLTGELYNHLRQLATKRGGEERFWNYCDGDENLIVTFASTRFMDGLPRAARSLFTEEWQGAEKT